MPTTPLYPAEFRTALIPPAQRKRRKNHRTVTMPERVGPHVKLVFAEMARQRVTYDETEERSGVRRASIKAWRRKNRPGLESLEAVLATLGFGLVPVAALEALPPRTRWRTHGPRAQNEDEHSANVVRLARHRR